jgi:hypothetical protein
MLYLYEQVNIIKIFNLIEKIYIILLKLIY